MPAWAAAAVATATPASIEMIEAEDEDGSDDERDPVLATLIEDRRASNAAADDLIDADDEDFFDDDDDGDGDGDGGD